jgi:hypothetical protein
MQDSELLVLAICALLIWRVRSSEGDAVLSLSFQLNGPYEAGRRGGLLQLSDDGKGRGALGCTQA